MSIQTLDDLEDFLDGELAWRKKELTTLKFSLERGRKHEQMVLTRASVCLLYAHWEGFIKASSRAYLEFVSTRRLPLGELTHNFMALGLRSDFRRAANSKSIKDQSTITRLLVNGLSERRTIPFDDAIDAHSNLDSRVLLEILETLGLDSRMYVTKKAMIDEKLLRQRNNVAHGEWLPLEVSDYQILHDDMIWLMEQFKIDVDNSATTRRYRRMT